MSQTTNTAKEVEIRKSSFHQLSALSFAVRASNDDTRAEITTYASIDAALTSLAGVSTGADVRACKCESSLCCWTASSHCSVGRSVGGARGRRS